MNNIPVTIPKSFTLGGTEWKIVWDNEGCNDKGNYGHCSYCTSTITLSTTYGLKDLSKDKIEQTFYHELVHAILDTMGEHDLSDNEKLVNTFSVFLHQYNKSYKYE